MKENNNYNSYFFQEQAN